MSKLLIDALNLFVGSREFDTKDEPGLDDWGHSYGPGSVLRERWTYSTENQTSTLDANQRSRNNLEQYHEWFPGLFVLDGRLDVKQPVFFLRLLILALVLFVPFTA